MHACMLWIFITLSQPKNQYSWALTVTTVKPLNNLISPYKEVSEHAVYLVLFNCPLPSWIIHNLLSASIQKGRWKRQYRWQEVKEKSLYKSPLSQFTWENVKSMLTAYQPHSNCVATETGHSNSSAHLCLHFLSFVIYYHSPISYLLHFICYESLLAAALGCT